MKLPRLISLSSLTASALYACLLLLPLAAAEAGRWETTPLGGGGYVTGLATDSAGSVFYCRTDVGGAFRWIPAANGADGSWISLTDRMVPEATSGAAGLMNVEGIAVDPNNARRLYIAAGSTKELHGIFCSEDQGATWTQVENKIRTQGNGAHRTTGERLAVDPNNSNILWYGSTLDGLQKGVKTGNAWSWTQIPAASVPFGQQNAGVTFVVCDKNRGKTIVYAGVYDPSAGGVYRSIDGGTTWEKIPGAALSKPTRAQVAANGTLYVTGGTDGVARLHPGEGLTKLASLPEKDGNGKPIAYHAVAVNPRDPDGNIVYVAQSSPGSGMLWRSADGGETWTKQDKTFNEGPATYTNHKRTEPDGTPSVAGYWFGATSSLLVNPANPSELWLGDFFGVSRTRNAQDLGGTPGAFWNTLQRGQEETVVLGLKTAPTGAKLIAGVADVGGFRYADVKSRPTGMAGEGFQNPHGGNNTSIDFCEKNPNVWVRAVGSPTGWGGTGAVSNDGGATWLRFGQLAARTVTNAPEGGWETWDVGIYLATQKAKGNNLVTLLVASSNTPEYSNSTLSFHSREATDAGVHPRLVINGRTNLNPVADTTVQGANPTMNYGNAPTLTVGYAWGQPANSRWVYLKFDLASISGPITSASLQLNRIAATNTLKFPVGVFACADTSWQEGTGGTATSPQGGLSWNTRLPSLSNGGDGNSKIGDPVIDYPLTNYISGSTHLWGGRIAVSSSDPNILVWAPVNAPPFYSTDRGTTWSASKGAGSQITGIYTNGFSVGMSGQPLASDRGNGNFYLGKFGDSHHEIFRSTDGGATWTKVSEVANDNSYNARTPQLAGAPVSPACPNGGDVWLCDDGTYGNRGGGLWRSTDSAATWTAIAAIAKATAVSFGKAATGQGYTVYVAGTKGGVKGIYRSDSYGTNWEILPSPTINELTAFAGDRQNYNSVFIGTGGRGIMHYDGAAAETVQARKIGR